MRIRSALVAYSIVVCLTACQEPRATPANRTAASQTATDVAKLDKRIHIEEAKLAQVHTMIDEHQRAGLQDNQTPLAELLEVERHTAANIDSLQAEREAAVRAQSPDQH